MTEQPSLISNTRMRDNGQDPENNAPQPALMSVRRSRVAQTAQQLRCVLVLVVYAPATTKVKRSPARTRGKSPSRGRLRLRMGKLTDYGERVLVVVEANLLSREARVRARVHDCSRARTQTQHTTPFPERSRCSEPTKATYRTRSRACSCKTHGRLHQKAVAQRIDFSPVGSEAAGEARVCGIVDIDHVGTAVARSRANAVRLRAGEERWYTRRTGSCGTRPLYARSRSPR